jgi:DNA-binding MarR family transcriptional regulator
MNNNKEELLKNTIDQYWETIPSVSRRVRSHARCLVMREFNLTLVQYDVLRTAHFGFCTVAEIADHLQISRPAASLAADQLVRKGLVSRTEDDRDRRFVNLVLTEKGESLIGRIFTASRVWMAEKMQALSPEELETLSAAFSLLRKTFTPGQESSR